MHQSGIKNLLLKLLSFNEHELDDLFQETCIKVYRSLKDFRSEASFSTWLYRITYHTFLSNQKKRNTYQSHVQRLSSTSVERPVRSQDFRLDAEKMIAILRPEEKVAIQLSYIEGFTHKDIASILDCPIGTVKTHIKRGKERIAKSFRE